MQSMPYYQQQSYQNQSPYQPGVPTSSSVLNTAPAMMNHPNGLPPMQHAGIPEQPQINLVQHTHKRKQVKNACTNCQKACKKCADARPCPRCIKYGIADTCVNSVRKERKKGIKRGPYKRRQKTGDEKTRKTTDMNVTDQSTQPAQYAQSIRGPALPFGYPTNLNQYGQPYDPYGQYATYHKDQMMPQPYVVNPVYPPMGYPVIVPGTGDNQQQPQQHPYQQHYNNMMQHSPTSRPPMMHSEHIMHQPNANSPQTQVYYQHQQQQQQQQHQQQQQQQQQHQQQQHHHPSQHHSQPPSQRSSPHLPEVKHDGNEGFAKPQSMTPVPSASTSTATISSPDSASWVPPRSS